MGKKIAKGAQDEPSWTERKGKINDPGKDVNSDKELNVRRSADLKDLQIKLDL